MKLACPTRQNSICKNTAIITIERKVLKGGAHAPSNKRRMVTMAAGAVNTPPGVTKVIVMKANRVGRALIRKNRGKAANVQGMMSISNSAGDLLSRTPIMMKIK